ncbi:DUF1592 domain-containing protein [Rhodopirellula sp. MGV]|uniref:DUF1592 domain-containing protein n=1 Tax=Rhodopirellula sp. MGV TaxID=2023130 RepID=UPI000B971D4B|nr:DUF1592 domain-containing protein [Rhodopirellula sp. MGV]OYP32986.1 hypothetical protein CGZ80_19010 [Rhodopirellula sp. MGV]PNY35356.1 DUF1592 domain-containing protein [Rhodopirellula baltica]
MSLSNTLVSRCIALLRFHGILFLGLATAHASPVAAAEDDVANFEASIAPLLQSYCIDCHTGDEAEAEIDLSLYQNQGDLIGDQTVWIKTRTMLSSGQMPPKDSVQPTDAERADLESWVTGYLSNLAKASAGDPGPVVLRRLNNDEYRYTIGDLTGVTSLNPTREFPVDGAAGEGFINSGEAQAMSPALVTKYLDAAKEVASHAVLTPKGIRFSDFDSRRDWTDERVQAIRDFYRRWTVPANVEMQVSGAGDVPNEGGTLPLRQSLLTLLKNRDSLERGSVSFREIAESASDDGTPVNAKYLSLIWNAFNADDNADDAIMNSLRRQWRITNVSNLDSFVASINRLQDVTFRFNSIGHMGGDGKPKAWIEGLNPIQSKQSVRLDLPTTPNEDLTIYLAVSDAGDGPEGDQVLFKNPRLTTDSGISIPLSKLAGLANALESRKKLALRSVTEYLSAINSIESTAISTNEEFQTVAIERNLDPILLKAWADYLGLNVSSTVEVNGRFQNTETNPTYPFIKSWGSGSTPFVSSNASDDQVRIPGVANPHKVFAHPAPDRFAAIGWQSPLDGTVEVTASLLDAHADCGGGQEWWLQHLSGRGDRNLWQGRIGRGGRAQSETMEVTVRKGDVISFLLGPGDEYTCDLTEMDLTINENGNEKRHWNLAQDVADDLLASNPHADQFGNADIWHFYQGDLSSARSVASPTDAIPPDSTLAQWLDESDLNRRQQLASQIQAQCDRITNDNQSPEKSADTTVCQQISHLVARNVSLDAMLREEHPDERFGPKGDNELAPEDLLVQAPAVLAFSIPHELSLGRRLEAQASLAKSDGNPGSVRIAVSSTPLTAAEVGLEQPTLAVPGSKRFEEIANSYRRFRELFPPAVCYTRIVPVDEVVTLSLYHRQDEALQRLILSEDEIATLNAMWDEMLFVAQEPLRYEVAFEQLREFATQDRPDLVKVWDPLKPGVTARAEAFRQRQMQLEPLHVNSVIEFANRAWRRPLETEEFDQIRDLYQILRAEGLDHEPAIKLLLARVLASPSFLYRREVQPPGNAPAEVNGIELANRLSYFLWSSMPDDELLQLALDGRLLDDRILEQQVDRMLDDPRSRRLAIQFACQWLHLRNFDQNDDKNEKLYPEFAVLRQEMYEETIRFFDDLFRSNRPVTAILDADHVFVNERMAKHYGIDGVHGDDWVKVDAAGDVGRGGILAMATVLASQSGASRTSPILRGNYVYETLLGQRLPRPPANVPQLPDQVPEGLTARQLIELHSSAPECAKCHELIDPYGFALEQYDAIGRIRPVPTDTSALSSDGTELNGIDGLRNYLLGERRDDFLRQFCRKLLGYSLGREVQLSDEVLLDEIRQTLHSNDDLVRIAVKSIVTSPPFRRIRGADWVQP